MAQSFQYDFKFNWSQPERATSAFLKKIEADLARLQSKVATVEGKGIPKEGTKARVAFDRDKSQAAVLEKVTQDRTRAQDAAQFQRLRRANLDVLSENILETQKNNQYLRGWVAQRKATDEEYLRAVINRRRLEAQEQIAIQERLLNADPRSEGGRALNAEARQKVNQSVLQAQQVLREQAAIGRLTKEQLGTKSGGRTGFAQLQAQAAVAQQAQAAEIKAETERQKAASGRYLNAVASATIAEEERKAAITNATLALRASNPGLAELQAQNNVRTAVLQAERATIEARLLAGSSQDLGIMAQRLVAEKELQVALNQRVAAEVRNATAAGQIQQGTFFQRVQSSIASRQGGNVRLPQEFQTGGQFLTSKALTTAGFAASGALFFGLISGARTAFEEANKLERQLVLINEQLVQADQAGDFPVLRKAILDISRDTGIASSELAFLALQLRGAFSNQDIGFVTDQLEAAAQIARVTSLPLDEITDSLTSLRATFGVTFREIGDVTVGLQSRFGVLAREIITFTADLAPAAELAGATFKEVAALGAVLQRSSGRSGAQLSEAIGRILPQIQENAGAIVSVLTSAEGQGRATERIISALGEGRTFDVLIELVKVFDQLGDSQKQVITTALGGRREASTLAGLFNDAKGYREELERIGKGDTDAGRLQKQFDALGETLNQTFAELKQSATQLGVALIAAGIAPTLKGIADAMQLLLAVARPLLGFLTAIDLGGTIGQFNLLGTAITPLLIMAGARGLSKISLGGLGAGAAGGGGGSGLAGRATSAGLAAFSLSGLAPQGVKAKNLEAQVVAAATSAGTQSQSAIVRTANRVQTAIYGPIQRGAITAKTRLLSGGNRLIQSLASFQGAFALTALLTTIDILQDAQEDTRKEIQDFDRKISGRLESDPEGLVNDAAKLRESALDKIIIRGSGLLGIGTGETPRERALKQGVQAINKQLSAQVRAFGRAGADIPDDVVLRNEIDPKVFDDPRALNEINERYRQVIAEVSSQVADPQRVLREAAKRTKGAEFRKAANKGDVAVTLSALQSQFEIGAISLSDFIDQVRRQRDGLAKVIANADHPTEEATKTLKAAEDTLTSALQERFKRNVDFALSIRRLKGIDVSDVDVSIVSSALKDPNLRSNEQRIAIVNQVFSTMQEIIQERIANAKTAAEALNIGETGLPVDITTQIAFVRVQLEQAIQQARGVSRKNLLSIVANGSEEKLNELLNEVARLQIENGLTYEAALRQVIVDTINDLNVKIAGLRQIREIRGRLNKRQKEQLQGLKEQLQAANGLLGAVDDAPELDQVALQIPTLQADNLPELRRNAAEEAKNLAKEIAEAELDFWNALIERNPVAVAENAIARADNAARFAENEAERIRAAADRIRAERQLQEAIFDITNSQIEFVLALVNSAGDTVKAAEVQLDLARQKLSQAQQLGAGEAEINRLRADIVNAEAALRDANLQNQLDTIDFNLEVEKISKAQAIAQLQALLSQADVLHLTEQQKRDLILKIRQLRQDLGRDLQFNLPSELRLPTLYEVRRLGQSGGNYQDNRNISIVLNANNSVDGQSVVQQITDALNSPPRVGVRPRIY